MRQAVSIARIDAGWVSVSVTHHTRRQGSRLITDPRSEETSCACRFGGLEGTALIHPYCYEQQPLADHQWVFQAHRAHIHMAR